MPSEDEAEEADGAGAETLPPTHAAAAAHARLSPGAKGDPEFPRGAAAGNATQKSKNDNKWSELGLAALGMA